MFVGACTTVPYRKTMKKMNAHEPFTLSSNDPSRTTHSAHTTWRVKNTHPPMPKRTEYFPRRPWRCSAWAAARVPGPWGDAGGHG